MRDERFSDFDGGAVVVLVLFALSCLAPVPASAAIVSPSAPQPVWVTLNALGYGNYPGGNEEFTVFVVNSDSPPLGNVTLINETLTASALPPNDTGSAIGLPVLLTTGQGLPSTIYLPIPSNFTQSSFTATVVVNLQVANGTSFFSEQLTKSTTVEMLSLPGTITPTLSSTTTTQSSGGVSSGLFYAGVAIPSVIAIILIALLARRRATSTERRDG